MEENHAIIGVLLVLAISVSAYFVLESGSIGAAINEPYLSCCCNILTNDGGQFLVRTQVQSFDSNCTSACTRYSGSGKIFPQIGLCAQNP